MKPKPLSGPDAAIFEELKEIKKAFKNIEKIKTGKLKGSPAEKLLKEL